MPRLSARTASAAATAPTIVPAMASLGQCTPRITPAERGGEYRDAQPERPPRPVGRRRDTRRHAPDRRRAQRVAGRVAATGVLGSYVDLKLGRPVTIDDLLRDRLNEQHRHEADDRRCRPATAATADQPEGRNEPQHQIRLGAGDGVNPCCECGNRSPEPLEPADDLHLTGQRPARSDHRGGHDREHCDGGNPHGEHGSGRRSEEAPDRRTRHHDRRTATRNRAASVGRRIGDRSVGREFPTGALDRRDHPVRPNGTGGAPTSVVSFEVATTSPRR